jgi:hypothetical protein
MTNTATPSERAAISLPTPHQQSETGDICREDASKPPIHTYLGHKDCPHQPWFRI